jgi:hypothetical protein
LAQLQLLLDITMFLLLLNETPSPWHCSCSSSTLFLLFFNNVPHQHYSLMLFLFLVVIPLQCRSYSYSLMPLLLLFNVILALSWCRSYSSYFKYLYAPPRCCCYSSFWCCSYSSYIFVGLGGNFFPNSTILGQVWSWIWFFLQMFVCWWLVPCFDYPCFFG